MAERWETNLARCVGAGLIEASAAERIRAYESEQGPARGLRWPVLLLGAGVLLFVAAH